ncbi:Oidioi.mRNA.OKI2018_I69.XSR.g14665.t1.cds [Oikopleura dioica]|uniref:Oidioi.mRNA.OKI2018_I69.XSR.g14665.t1.cds n=1 Tax=Oikopleura dioica TaxID=34765 RepID=A0ABN7SGS4_OIKDI|nr:Oidioi.mRNA.OKI2018_I69.XSR.g14665.t1.cds [Oikopleura dioica]
MKIQLLTVSALLQSATSQPENSLADVSSLLNPDSSIVKEDDFRQNPKIDDYLNRLIRKIFPELEPVDEPTLQSIREKIDVAVNETGVANITEIFNEMKDSQEVDYTIAKPDSSNEYGGEYDYYPNSGGLDKDDWNIFYDPDVPRGDGRSSVNVAPFQPRQAVVDKFIERKMVKSEVHGNKVMFTIDHSLSSRDDN